MIASSKALSLVGIFPAENNKTNGARRLLCTLMLGVFFALLITPLHAGSDLPQNHEELEALIDERVEARLRDIGLSDDMLDTRIEQGIVTFIAKQRQAQEQAPQNKAQQVRPVSLDDDHIYGDPQAPVSLIEYSDYECPFCKRFHPVARKLVDDNPGQVNWVYRHFPLGFHNPGAQKQAEGAECAAELGGNQAFWKFTDLIYARTKSNGKGFPVAQLVPLASEVGLDEKAFSRCLDSGRFTAKVQQQYADGVAAGVTGTPGNILRHKDSGRSIAVHGAQPYARVEAALKQLIGGAQ
jgi:protein-disulfide isomerase